MKTYLITYNDKTTEYVEAYGVKKEGMHYVFDIGHGNKYVVSNVKRVEAMG